MMFFRRRPRTRREDLITSIVRAYAEVGRHQKTDLMRCHPNLYFAVARLAAYEITRKRSHPESEGDRG